MSTLDELKKQFAEPSQTFDDSDAPWKKRYDFWKMEVGEQAVVRFIKDADPDNPMQFILENITHNLQVNGKRKVVPCLSMYGKPCPCCALSQKYYSEEGDNSVNGQRLWKKREYLAAVKVLQDPVGVDNVEETKYVALGPKIFKLIQEAFKSDDLEVEPYNLDHGYDFRIKKSQQGQYANYDLSSFSPKQTALPEDVQANLEYLDLKEYRANEITTEQMEAYILADQTGQTVETVSNVAASAPQTTTATVDAAPQTPQAPAAEAPQTQVAEAAPADSNDKVNDILAQIRNAAPDV